MITEKPIDLAALITSQKLMRSPGLALTVLLWLAVYTLSTPNTAHASLHSLNNSRQIMSFTSQPDIEITTRTKFVEYVEDPVLWDDYSIENVLYLFRQK